MAGSAAWIVAVVEVRHVRKGLVQMCGTPFRDALYGPHAIKPLRMRAGSDGKGFGFQHGSLHLR